MKTYHTRRNTVPYQTMEYQNEPHKNPHIEVLYSDPPQSRVNGKIIPWPQGKTPEEAYRDYLKKESQPVPPNQLSEEEPSPAEEQHFVRQQEHSLHPLRQQYLQDRLKQLDYLDRQQARQDDFTTRMYGKKDYSKEQEKIRQELRASSTPQKRQAEKSPLGKIYKQASVLNCPAPNPPQNGSGILRTNRLARKITPTLLLPSVKKSAGINVKTPMSMLPI